MNLLYSPPTLPSFGFLVAALDYPPARELARYLHVSERTVYAWLAADKAPMAARLALFWITHYGRSEIECHAQNGLMHYKMLSDSLGNVVKQQRARIDWLERNGQFGAANNPYFLSDSCKITRIERKIQPSQQHRHHADTDNRPDNRRPQRGQTHPIRIRQTATHQHPSLAAMGVR